MHETSFGQLCTTLLDPALWLVTSAHGANRGGLIATFVANASLVPDYPRVAIGIAKHHFTWQLINSSRAFAVHLVDDSHFGWVRHFGLRSGHQVDKFEGILPAGSGSSCPPVFTDAVLWAECVVEATVDTGDRSIFVGHVLKHGHNPNRTPLTVSTMSTFLSNHDFQTLKEQLGRDIANDAAAIRKWSNHLRGS